METPSRFIAEGRKGNNFLDSALEACMQPVKHLWSSFFSKNVKWLFSTSWKSQNTRGFMTFLGVVENLFNIFAKKDPS